jgi:hypothetical protein
MLCYVLSELKPPFTLYHYELIILPTNVRRCYGCNCEFVGLDKYRQEPYHIIVKHVDRRIVQKDPVTHSPDFSTIHITIQFLTISGVKIRYAVAQCALSSSLCASISTFQKQVL